MNINIYIWVQKHKFLDALIRMSTILSTLKERLNPLVRRSFCLALTIGADKTGYGVVYVFGIVQ